MGASQGASAGINPVRQMVDRRFKSSQQLAVPNSTMVRVEARGSAFYTLPPAKGGRIELDVPLGRLVLLDAPDQNAVPESYSAKK